VGRGIYISYAGGGACRDCRIVEITPHVFTTIILKGWHHMAKQVREAEPEFSARDVKALVKNVIDHYTAMESAKATYANRCMRERDAMGKLYEKAAQEHAIPQNVAKLHVKIVRKKDELIELMKELDAEEQAIARKMAKLQADPAQLALWNSLPVLKMPKRAANENSKRKTPGVSGEDISAADESAATDQTLN
jgi:hypothetical protein